MLAGDKDTSVDNSKNIDDQLGDILTEKILKGDDPHDLLEKIRVTVEKASKIIPRLTGSSGKLWDGENKKHKEYAEREVRRLVNVLVNDLGVCGDTELKDFLIDIFREHGGNSRYYIGDIEDEWRIDEDY